MLTYQCFVQVLQRVPDITQQAMLGWRMFASLLSKAADPSLKLVDGPNQRVLLRPVLTPDSAQLLVKKLIPVTVELSVQACVPFFDDANTC